MKSDISRAVFDRTRSYLGVLLQKGRVLLDADVDERGRGDAPGRKVAAAHCVECKRAPAAGEVWRLYFDDLEEVAAYCPSCAKRAFGDG